MTTSIEEVTILQRTTQFVIYLTVVEVLNNNTKLLGGLASECGSCLHLSYVTWKSYYIWILSIIK